MKQGFILIGRVVDTEAEFCYYLFDCIIGLKLLAYACKFTEGTTVNEFNEYVRECFSVAGDVVIKPMMGGYLVYLNGKLIGDIGDNELFLKRTPTSDRILSDSELRFPYEGSKTLMHVFDKFEDMDLIAELLAGMYAELPEKKPGKSK